MASFDYRLNPLYPIKECSSCGALYTTDYCCSNGSLVGKIIYDLNKAPDLPHLHTFSSNQHHCFHCKDVLGDGELCQRCTCMRCGSGLSKGLCLICGNNQNSLNDSPSVFKNSSQSPPHINHHCCYECGDPLDGIFCKRCTCKSCGKGAHIGYNCPPKVSVISNPEPYKNQTIDELPQTLSSFHPTCYSGDESPFTCDSTPNIVDDSPNVFNPPPQTPKYSYEFCGNDAYYGYDYPPQVPFTYDPEPCYNQDFNIPQNSQNFQQQYLCCTCCGGPHETFQCQQVIFYEPCCENCEGPHETYQCQPMNEDCYHEQNSCYDSNSFGFDQILPQQLPVIDQTHLKESMKILRIALQAWSKNIQQKKKEEEKQIAEEQAAKARYWKIPICYDDDEDYTIAITPKEPNNSLSMGDEHLDTLPATKSNEFIKSSVENLVPNPSEPEGEHEYILKKIYSNPLFDKEIISMKIDLHHFNAESDLIESLLNHDSSIISSSSKIDSLLDEFVDELILLKSIPPGINKADCDPKEEIHLDEKFLYDNSSLRPSEEFISKNSDAIIESFSPSPILVEDSDPLMEEIDSFLASDGSIPSGIDSDYSDSKGDNLFLERLLHDDPIPLPDTLDFLNVVRVFLPFFTYQVTSSIRFSSGSEDTIFDPGISNYHFSSFEPGVSHWSGAFIKFNVYPNYLNESPMEILSSTCFPMEQ
nr:hypothetical protein [Tanacetum cinerariifolium]